MDLNLMNCMVIVIGGVIGLGREFVFFFVKEGVNICFIYMCEEEYFEWLIEMVKISVNVEIIVVKIDFFDEQSWENLFVICIDRLGKVDILVNNVGIWLSGYVIEISLQDWDLVMNVNLKVIFYFSQLFVNYCLQYDQMGSILNIILQVVFYGFMIGYVYYVVSKVGLVVFVILLVWEVVK